MRSAGREPGRDRVPGLPHLPHARHLDGRDPLRRGRRAAVRPRGRRRRTRCRATPRPRPTSTSPLVLAAAKAVGRRRDPPGLRLPVRERRLRPRGHRRRADLGRPDARVHRRDGLEDRRQGADAEGRRARPWRRPSRRPRRTSRCWSRRPPVAAAAACGSSARSPTWTARSRPRRPRRSRRSATGPSSSSRTSSAAGTSRSRSSAPSVYGDRDCSLQRRHQKVVEEAPAPGLREEVRAALHDAARRAAEAIDYRGAGTVEFLYDPATERFWFLEMNTRLQVEHPVTELVHGVDLVELQLAAAEADWTMGWPDPPRGPRDRGPAVRRGPGRGLPAAERDAHAVRHPRSSPASGWTPASRPGSEVSTYYDAMLAKVIAHAPTREQAARKLAGRAGARADPRRAAPTATSWSRVLRDERFLAGEVSTDLPRALESSLSQTSPQGAPRRSCGDRLAELDREQRTVQQGIPVAWRNVVSQPQVTEFEGGIDGRVVGRTRRLRPRGRSGGLGEPDQRGARVGRRPDVLRRGSHRRRAWTSTGRAATRPCGVPRGSSTRPTRSRAAACWRRCPAPSSASRSSRASRSRPGSRCSSSRR